MNQHKRRYPVMSIQMSICPEQQLRSQQQQDQCNLHQKQELKSLSKYHPDLHQ